MKLTLAILILTLFLFTGCAASKSQIRMDELTAKVEKLEQHETVLIKILQQLIDIYNAHIIDLHSKGSKI